MPQAFNIAPRVVVYSHGTSPPPVEEGWLLLPRLPAPASVPCGQPPGSIDTPPRHHTVFGDGSHPTTRLCAAAVDLLCRQRSGIAVLDVGTGTGILARIARARGASFVVGTDINPAAVACAREHAELDNVGMRCLAGKAAGSRINIHFGDETPDHWGARFHLVVANILEAPLHSLASALCRALVPGGVLLISGFTHPQVPALRLAYKNAGLQSAGDFNLDEWVLLKFVARTRVLPSPR
jgi:ribosomal protein L11 methyltransferase